MMLLAEQTNSSNVSINLWPSNSKGKIMMLRLSFFCPYCSKFVPVEYVNRITVHMYATTAVVYM